MEPKAKGYLQRNTLDQSLAPFHGDDLVSTREEERRERAGDVCNLVKKRTKPKKPTTTSRLLPLSWRPERVAPEEGARDRASTA